MKNGKKSANRALWVAIFLTALSTVTPWFSSPVQAAEYRLGPGDVLQINVWGHDDLAQVVEVRPDGLITFPLVGEIKAGGMQPAELQTALEVSLGEYVRNPHVTVVVKQFRTRSYLERAVQILTGLTLIKQLIQW